MGIRRVRQHQVPELAEVRLIYDKFIARVAARYALMSQHIIVLIRVFAIPAKCICVVLRGVNPQPSCGGKLPPTLLTDAVARLFACVANLEIGIP